jgi:hypothetical protein
MTDIRLVGGKHEDVARALMDGKPCSPALEAMYSRVIEEHIRDLAAKHGVTMESSDAR